MTEPFWGSNGRTGPLRDGEVPMGSVLIDASISDDQRRARLYEGDIFIFSPTNGSRTLIDLARRMSRPLAMQNAQSST
jgi:hypothetical protein